MPLVDGDRNLDGGGMMEESNEEANGEAKGEINEVNGGGHGLRERGRLGKWGGKNRGNRGILGRGLGVMGMMGGTEIQEGDSNGDGNESSNEDSNQEANGGTRGSELGSIVALGEALRRTILPQGFLASGINCGVRRYRPDLGLLVSESPAVGVGVFTRNRFRAAPVLYSMGLLPSSSIRAIVTNSGQANAATGERGWEDNLAMARGVASVVGCPVESVLTASTGVIGQFMSMDRILPAMGELYRRCNDVAESFALAILTTDLVPKVVSTKLLLPQGEVQITGICKGSGMIHPNMGTMLGYILTDAEMAPPLAQRLLRESVDQSFNMVSVDGDTSTNDAVFFLANGKSRVRIMEEGKEGLDTFRLALNQVCIALAQAIASDGEGATKLIEVNLRGVHDLRVARRLARSIVVSPLVKTAVHGGDPNWGRILARIGAEWEREAQRHELDRIENRGDYSLDQLSLSLQGFRLFENGVALDFDWSSVHQRMKQHRIVIDINLQSGPYAATAWGCDLSHKYVDINTEYN